MADEDEIDVLGDFSFNSCFAQNSQGIPSCSNREDTVHPQWLLDSTANNWYDTQNIDRNRLKEGPSRRLSGNNTTNKYSSTLHTVWSQAERDVLQREMAKYGRNVRKISQTLKTKTEAEIQALIEAEHGIHLDTPVLGLDKYEGIDTPTVIQEEIVTDDPVSDVLSMVTTGSPTIAVLKQPFKKKNNITKISNSKVQPKNSKSKVELQTNVMVDPAEIFYEDDLTVGSTELIKSEIDTSRNTALQHKERIKVMKKIGNHRRKVSRNYDKTNRNRSKDNKKSPQGRQRKDSSLSMSDDSVRSPKMQIVLGSGQALPVSEGEQVIKIEKKKDSECESDIEVDIDSDSEASPQKTQPKQEVEEAPIAVPLRKFEPMPKRNRKIPLDGGGGYTIMHTEAGDLYEIGQEPRKERAPKKPTIHLIQCRLYSDEKPPPCEVHLHVSALISMDVHAHTSRAEVMGLVGGEWCEPRLYMRLYRTARAAAAATHCDMDPVSQACAAEWLRARGLDVCGWHHSHPRFPAAPSAQDLRTQRALQRALRWPLPFLALITSQHWPARTVPSVSRLRCFRVEETEEATDTPIGYQLKVKLVPDLTTDNLAQFVRELRDVVAERDDRGEFSVNVAEDVCPQAGMTYLEKCVLSIRHHMQSAGYEHDAPLVELLVRGVRHVVR
ncbi:uncharacterized protein [Maniola hyperantus]|uniref:uncharacterized protein isoform X1 n=1 Tax=Aphantopus hyperantus TaxID=2795564 RepID=UPI00156A6162|nr:uncharacterized protein LOC117987963 [Maniola hyperantus]